MVHGTIFAQRWHSTCLSWMHTQGSEVATGMYMLSGWKWMVQILEARPPDPVPTLQCMLEFLVEICLDVAQEGSGEHHLDLCLRMQEGADALGIVNKLLYILFGGVAG